MIILLIDFVLPQLPQSTTAGTKVIESSLKPEESTKSSQWSESLPIDKDTDKASPEISEVLQHEHHEERYRLRVSEEGVVKDEERRENGSAVDTVIAHVTPCPIEPKDGNKEEEKPVVEEMWRRQKAKLTELPSLYLQLSKSRLTSKFVLTFRFIKQMSGLKDSLAMQIVYPDSAQPNIE